MSLNTTSKISRVQATKERDSLRWVSQEARRIAAGGTPRGRKWSLCEVCEHLALAVEGTACRAQPGPPPSWQSLGRLQRAKRFFIKHYMLTTGWFPKDVPAPSTVMPSKAVELEDAIRKLEKATYAFDRKLTSGDPNWVYHSLLGKMSGRKWLRFHSIHAAHHFSFFK